MLPGGGPTTRQDVALFPCPGLEPGPSGLGDMSDTPSPDLNLVITDSTKQKIILKEDNATAQQASAIKQNLDTLTPTLTQP